MMVDGKQPIQARDNKVEPKAGALKNQPTPEEKLAWNTTGKLPLMKAIQQEHYKTMRHVAAMQGKIMYTDKRGNS
jgi:hypothetical protein